MLGDERKKELKKRAIIDYGLSHKRLRKTRLDLKRHYPELGFELATVGEETGIGEQYLGQLELNRKPGVWAHILMLAAYYGTTTDYLLGAPWAGNPERNPLAAHTTEAARAVEILDSYPPAVRAVLLASLEAQAKVLSKLVDQASENIQLRLALSEYAARLSADDIRVSNAAVEERLMQLLTTDDGETI